MESPADLSLRFETKIPLQRAQYLECKVALISMGLFPKKSYPDRQVNSIYLDTPGYDYYQDNVTGLSRRLKTRIRWYQNDFENLTLEIKYKNNKVSGKRAFPMENKSGLIPRDRFLLRRLFRNNPSSVPLGILQMHRPVLETEYARQYFAISPNIRMTIDSRIIYRNVSKAPGFLTRRSPVDYVIEFKYPVTEKTQFNSLLQGLPFRVFRHSKYVVGINCLNIC